VAGDSGNELTVPLIFLGNNSGIWRIFFEY